MAKVAIKSIYSKMSFITEKTNKISTIIVPTGEEPTLVIIGVSHKEAKLEERETFSLNESEIELLSNDLSKQEAIEECLVLNTCNRLEIYSYLKQGFELKNIQQFITSHPTLRDSLFLKYHFVKTQTQAIEHSFELAAGLASQMIGETEILGQIKNAYKNAQYSKFSNTRLTRLLEKSFQAAKIIRTQTRISRGQVSIGTVAVHLATRIFGNIKESRILLIGSGFVSEKTAQALKTKGVTDITVTSRSKDKNHQLSEKFSAASIHFHDIKNQIKHYDIVISSTSSTETIIGLECIEDAIKKRPNRPLFLIDLAVPRDIEESIANLKNIHLYNLDALATIANENIEQRKLELNRAKQIVKSRAWNFWLKSQRQILYRKIQ